MCIKAGILIGRVGPRAAIERDVGFSREGFVGMQGKHLPERVRACRDEDRGAGEVLGKVRAD